MYCYESLYCLLHKSITGCPLGVPALKKTNGIWLGDTYFEQFFHEDLKNVTLIKIEPCLLICRHCLPCLLNFAEQASWAELTCRGSLSDQKVKKGTLLGWKTKPLGTTHQNL